MRLGVTLALTALLSVLATSDAGAVPAFARKYGKSCQTCHVAFPKLNAFGEAFRRNGYRFPGGEDEDSSEDEPVALGQKAYKKVFPDAVWPGQVPGQVPLGVALSSAAELSSEDDPKLSFADIGSSAALTAAGTLGDTFSAWAGIEVESEGTDVEVELERVFAVAVPFEEPSVALRVGRFEPRVSSMTVHRTLGFAPWFLTTRVADNEFTLDPAQVGLEIFGTVASGRLGYAVGVVEGAGNQPNLSKDPYARVSYKIGGMRLDGIGGATSSKPWRDDSVTLGCFGYFGQATVGDGMLASQGDRFGIAGFDLDARIRDLDLQAVFSYGRNKRPSLDEPNERVNSFHVLTQADYVVFPWLIPTLRVEWRRVMLQETSRLSGGIYGLVRANVRLFLLAAMELEGVDTYESTEGRVGLSLAF